MLYVDYGNTETISLASLTELDNQFHQLPYQCIHCKLVTIQRRSTSMGTEWSTQDGEHFFNLVADTGFSCSILGREDTPMIPTHLVDLDFLQLKKNYDCNVGACLVDSGLAMFTTAGMRQLKQEIEHLSSDQRNSPLPAATTASQSGGRHSTLYVSYCCRYCVAMCSLSAAVFCHGMLTYCS